MSIMTITGKRIFDIVFINDLHTRTRKLLKIVKSFDFKRNETIPDWIAMNSNDKGDTVELPIVKVRKFS